MTTCVQRIDTLEDLRDYIDHTICQRNELQAGTFRLTQRTLYRGTSPCGVYFCLHGPRAVKFIAIWETDCNSILFYDSNGERIQRTRLATAPALEASVDAGLETAAA